jgi:hypothetical protein
MSTLLGPKLRALLLLGTLVLGLGLAGCGGGGSSTSSTVAAKSTSQGTTVKTAAGGKVSCGSSVTPTTSEAASTAAGDIPDNQQFLTFGNRAGGYSIKYPEGWARTGSGANVSFQDKSNTITIAVVPGSAPTPSSVGKQLQQQKASDPCLSPGTPQAATVGPNRAVKVTYTTRGAKSPVTGQRNKVSVDRYVFFKGGKVATLDLSNPVGVDNVDAYRMISESFRWS